MPHCKFPLWICPELLSVNLCHNDNRIHFVWLLSVYIVLKIYLYFILPLTLTTVSIEIFSNNLLNVKAVLLYFVLFFNVLFQNSTKCLVSLAISFNPLANLQSWDIFFKFRCYVCYVSPPFSYEIWNCSVIRNGLSTKVSALFLLILQGWTVRAFVEQLQYVS